jgi:bla regulator protein blaR1
MNPTDLSPLANHLWQSTLFAAGAGLLTLVLRKNRAAVRYWIWLAVSVKFLLPFSLLVAVGNQLEWRSAPAVVQPQVAIVMDQISQPFATSIEILPVPRGPQTAYADLPTILGGIWLCGVVAGLIFWGRLLTQMRAIRHAATALDLRLPIPVLSASEQTRIEPGVFGIVKPVLILPAGITDRLTPAQLAAVLAHELCHARRRDNLTATIHMAVEVIFWFHPLVWLIRAQLIEERERACDEEVLKMASEPQVYAEAILNVCKLYVGAPLICVSGIAGADLKRRIETIMRNQMALRLNFPKKALLVTAATVAVAAPVMVGILNLPDVHAQAKSATPKFEVASVRLSKSCVGSEAKAISTGGGPRPAGAPPPPPPRSAGGIASTTSPGRLNECHTLADLIHMAYFLYAEGRYHPVWGPAFEGGPPLEGGPAWIRSDIWQVTAKAEGTQSGTPGREMMSGPMLQTLLEDRFKLKVRRASRDVPIYALTVDKAGSKLTPSSSTCLPRPEHQPGDPFVQPQLGQKFCQDKIGFRNGPNTGLETEATTLDGFCVLLGRLLERPVVNKTGIAGEFDIRMEFAIDGSISKMPAAPLADTPVPATGEPGGASVFTVIQKQLGLKLDPAKGPGDFLVVDHVERPSEN